MNRTILKLVGVPLLMGSAANAALLVHYTFDADNAANSGSGGDGTAVGGSTYAPGVSGNAWQGNRAGANDAYVQTGLTGDALGFGAGGTYTAMAWVNWAGGEGSVDHMVFGQEDGAGNNPMLHHGIRDDSAPLNVHFGGWGGAQDIGDAGAVPIGEWTHVAWQYDGTNKKVFVDGVLTADVPGNNITDPTLDVIVGGHGRDAADPAGQSFNGLLDDVRIYDNALTIEEINDAKNMVPEPSTLSLFCLAALGLIRRRR